MDVAGYFTALGLSTAAGLNAYIPLLTVGLLHRYTDLIDLGSPWDRLGDPVVMGIVTVVGVADFVGDKVPVVDHVLHLIGTLVAPVVGAILALATATAFDLDPGLAAGLGVAAALATQVGRTAARPVSTVTTGGGGNPVVSFAEDGVSGVLSVTAVLWPVVTAILAVLVLVGVYLLWRRWRAFRSRLQARYRSPVRTGLTFDDLGDLLDEPIVAVLATLRADGSVLLSPVWHEWRDGGFNVWTGVNDVKVRHLRRDPRASILVAESTFPLRGVEVRGQARLVEEGGAETAVRIAGRYLGPQEGADYVGSSGDDVIVRVEPGELRVWDFADEHQEMGPDAR